MSLPCPGSNGIREWTRQKSHPTGWLSRGAFQFYTICLVTVIVIGMLIGSPAHASQDCMTYHEARQVWKHEYLHWHGDHCWTAGDASRLRRTRSLASQFSISKAVPAARIPLPKSKPFVLLLEQAAADPSFEDRWPTNVKSTQRFTVIGVEP